MSTFFDDKATQWDADPKKTERAAFFAKEIITVIPPGNRRTALEFGCGTGLLSYQLKDQFKAITLMDNSEGMIDVLKAKIQRDQLSHFTPVHADLFDTNTVIAPVDVIYTLMTLHHMTDLLKTLQTFHSLIHPNGFVCIADLVKEDGSFHAAHPGFDGHNGFDKKELSSLLTSNGFQVAYYHEGYAIEKETPDGVKKYPLFLMVGRKVA